jgi:hypothetical protein
VNRNTIGRAKPTKLPGIGRFAPRPVNWQRTESWRISWQASSNYVGMTGLDPDVCFDKHKAGIQSNRYVQQFGLRLLPDLYEVYNPMPYDGARDMEVELAIGLREAGYGVWQA